MKRFLMYTIIVVCALLGAFLIVVYYKTGKDQRSQIRCSSVNIVVTDSLQNRFILADDVKGFLNEEYGECLGTAVDSINLDRIEEILKNKSAVMNCEAFVTRNGKLNIEVSQRQPIVRFVGRNGGYYADRYGRAFPLQSTYTSYVQTVDGCIPDMDDSTGIKKIVNLVNYLDENPLWRKKIVNISADSTGNITLIPRKGQEKFLFGQPEDIEEKMERIKLYYTSIIPATDSSRYTTVNVKYSGQIICK